MTFGDGPAASAPRWSSCLAVAMPPLLVRGAAVAWSVPALAPLLGLVGLAGAFPALAGTARSALERAALGAPAAPGGCCSPSRCWATTCCSASAACPRGRAADGAASIAAERGRPADRHLRRPLLLVLWAAAAVVLPWLVRGRSLAVDIVGATVWAAGLAAATALARRGR